MHNAYLTFIATHYLYDLESDVPDHVLDSPQCELQLKIKLIHNFIKSISNLLSCTVFVRNVLAIFATYHFIIKLQYKYSLPSLELDSLSKSIPSISAPQSDLNAPDKKTSEGLGFESSCVNNVCFPSQVRIKFRVLIVSVFYHNYCCRLKTCDI